MGRQWDYEAGDWKPWFVVPIDMYEKAKDDETVKKDWEFVVRPLPIDPVPQNSPADGSFVPLTMWEEGFEKQILEPGKLDPKGHLPPVGIFVEFEVTDSFDGPIMRKGVTGELRSMGPASIHGTVFITGRRGAEDVYSPSRVSRWREVADHKQFTADMWEYVSPELRPK
jgi:hypothetical protein